MNWNMGLEHLWNNQNLRAWSSVENDPDDLKGRLNTRLLEELLGLEIAQLLLLATCCRRSETILLSRFKMNDSIFVVIHIANVVTLISVIVI
ncbi:uncharacterized protein CCOS01_03140 [Colletotrichum costaricense]|uniref:Uncharacterized protein n=1 Tax=Colletotrichum costaricense TaxID=1209916 RepID=A0AAI9Z4S4_9PEZI|nr:uncharacterized protein CCOS01_03140 [Colletotrichum costaricense]KAK1534388.1 hypothetical protein CCOS01_03140 [Colletotrichum costaricense]